MRICLGKRIELKNLIDIIENATVNNITLPNESEILDSIGQLRIDIKSLLNSINNKLSMIRNNEKIIKEKLQLLENNSIKNDFINNFADLSNANF
jgi:hypothetical protein